MMKKVLAVLLAAVMLISLIPMSVFAENGPMSEPVDYGYGDVYLSWISGIEPNAQGQYYDEYAMFVGTSYSFFENIQVNNNAYAGITYSKQTNTLTLNNVNAPMLLLSANVMGDDFKMEIIGTCALGGITVWGDNYGGNLNFVGDGSLTVNRFAGRNNAIVMNAEMTPGQVNFGKDVKVHLYASEAVIATFDSTLSNAAQVYTFANGQGTDYVQKYNYSYDTPKNIVAVFCENPSAVEQRGYVGVSKSDPNGVYAVSSGYRDDPNQTLYWVAKFVYLEAFDSYIVDYDYFKDHERYDGFGELEFTEAQWEAQSEYAFQTRPSGEPAQIQFYDPDKLNGNEYYVENQLLRTSDPTGIYAYNTFTEKVNNEEKSGINIHRFIYAEGTNKLIRDTSFKEIEVFDGELDTDEWTVVPGVEEIPFVYQGNCNTSYCSVYKDAQGKEYVPDYIGQKVYSIQEGYGVEIGDEFYYYMTPADNVTLDSLTLVVETTQVQDRFNYALLCGEFEYVGNGQAAHQHAYNKTVYKPGAYTLGYTAYRCACGESYVANYTAPVGKVAGFKCKARTANAQAITWNKIAASSVAGYQVQVSNAAGNKWEKAVVTSTNAITFKGLTAGGNYKFRIRFFVRGTDGKNYFSAWTVLASPTLPAGTTLKAVAGAKAFTAQWKKAAVNGYQIQYGLKSNFAGAKTITVKNPKTVKYLVKNLKAKSTYYVRIRTYKTIGKANYFSAWSATKVRTK